MNGYLATLKKYADFSGRARRTEYWLFVLFTLIIAALLFVVDYLLESPGIIAMIFGAAMLLPYIAVGVRRLHDTDRSGWWYLVTFVPAIGSIWLLILLVLDSTPGGNRFGANPKAAAV